MGKSIRPRSGRVVSGISGQLMHHTSITAPLVFLARAGQLGMVSPVALRITASTLSFITGLGEHAAKLALRRAFGSGNPAVIDVIGDQNALGVCPTRVRQIPRQW